MSWNMGSGSAWLAAALVFAGCAEEDAPVVGRGDAGQGRVDAGSAGGGSDADAGSTSGSSGDSSTPTAPPVGDNGGTSGGIGEDAGKDDSCDTVVLEPERLPPDMMIVLDRSGSMDEEVDAAGGQGGATRWVGSVQAIDQVVAELEDVVQFGLMTFPGRPACTVDEFFECQACGLLGGGSGGNCSVDPEVCESCTADAALGDGCGPAGLDVPMALGNAQPITAALGMMEPNGATPTAQSLAAAREVLSMREQPDNLEFPPPQYVMLVTDGDPNCFTTTGGNNEVDPQAQQETIAEAEAMAAQNILTYVIGFQTAGTTFASVLDQAAVAGGTGDTAHRSVSSGEELLEEFRQIAGKAASCTFVFAREAMAPNVEILIDGEAADRGDWVLLDDKRTVELSGQACEALQRGGTVEANLYCEPIPLL